MTNLCDTGGSMKDGGPAFPCEIEVIDRDYGKKKVICVGMSLRQWYAGLAMQGILAKDTGLLQADGSRHSYETFAKATANFARALMEEMEK